MINDVMCSDLIELIYCYIQKGAEDIYVCLD